MRTGRGLRTTCAVAWLAGCGCSSLREIPRTEYAAQETRKDVKVETRDGLVYEFDEVTVAGDSLVGTRRRDVEGPVDEFATLRLPLDEISHMRARGVDWYRTALIGSGALAAVVVAGLTASHNSDSGSSSSGGGGGGRVP
ncbi:MAG: hypothetical protein HYR73_00170 [Candidatus Eisenbacteria bacterium]|nr:hypothetical protein [Candidatus Eisenbacteria bacterium]